MSESSVDDRAGRPAGSLAARAQSLPVPAVRRARRAVLALAVALSAAVIGACGPPPLRQPDFERAWLVPANVLQRWHEAKDRLGPTFAGTPAWRTEMEFLERELRERGVRILPREPVSYARWHTADDPAAGRWSLAVDGKPVEVASYWAYSGATSEAGVTAPLVLYDPKAPGDLEGKIVVFQVPALPEPLPPVFQPPAREFATVDLGAPGLATDQWYQSNYPTRFGRWDEVLRKGGAAGGLVVFDMGPGRARGLYTFPLLSAEPVGVPGLYLDREAGRGVIAAAQAGRSATLRLLAETTKTDAWFLAGVLPGRDFGTDEDELVLLVTHTDGPNLTQENGPLAILAVVDWLAKVTALERRRSVLVLLDPQHYMPGRHLVDWYAKHPEIERRIVAGIVVEQLGQREYVERDGQFVPSGRPETTLLFAQDNPRLVQMAIDAVVAEGLPRTEVRVPARGQGQWSGLRDVIDRRIPGFGTSTDMSAYWSTAPGIESFDSELAYRQVAAITRLTLGLMEADLAAIAIPDRAKKHGTDPSPPTP